jgi:hypothetical protein
MKQGLQQALNNTEEVYSELVDIANSIVEEHTSTMDALIKTATDNVENLTDEDIRLLMIKLSLYSYSFGDIKEKSELKLECAETLRKEKYATEFNKSDGSVAVRDNAAILGSSDEVLTETIYTLVASLFETKLDSAHRVVDALKSVLMSRMSEAKLTMSMDNEGSTEQ